MLAILDLVMKYKVQFFIGALITALVTGIFFWQKNLKDDAAFWRNEAAKNKGLFQVQKNLYETQAVELSKLQIGNKDLKNRLDKTGREAVYYQNLSLEYKRQLGLISTTPPDTIMIKDTVNIDPRDRFFNKWFGQELHIKGFFQPYNPYNLFVDSLTLYIRPEIVLSQADDGTWFWDLYTNSDYLKAAQVDVQVKTRKTPFEFFIGANIFFPKLKITNLTGFGINTGLKKGNWALSGGVQYLNDNDIITSIGITRFWEF